MRFSFDTVSSKRLSFSPNVKPLLLKAGLLILGILMIMFGIQISVEG